jgi:signal transduction histidine kinase/ABC-type nitrate/sulfonate/bicarbonate transport system substrate-binding protein
MYKIKYILTIFLFLISFLNAEELKKVTLQLSWFNQFQFAGYYVAKQKGYFKDYGLDVTIKPFHFGINAVLDVDSKKADFSIARETLILDRVAGKKVVALYALFQDSPLALLSLKKSGIDSIEKFKNKKIMTTVDDASEISIKAMLQSKNLDFKTLNFIKHTHKINDLINGKVDIMSAYVSKSPYDLKKMNIKYNIFSPKDYGFDMYSDFLITNEDLVKNNLQTVLAFKEAALKGWKYAFSNIDETSRLIFDKYNEQNLSLDAIEYEGKVLRDLAYPAKEKLGEIKLEKIQRIYDLYNVLGLIDKQIDVKKLLLKNSSEIFLNKEEYIYLNNNKKINMCVIPNIKPYSFIGKTGEFKGFVADYIKLIEKRTSFKFNLVRTSSFKESLEYLKSGKCDILSSAEDIKTRRDFANFTKPFIDISLVLITKDNRGFVDDITVLKDQKIGIYKYYSFNKTLKNKYPNHNFVDVNSIEESIEKIKKGELFGHIDLLLTSWDKIQENEFEKLKISAKLNLSVPLSIAIKKDDFILYKILEKAVDSISKEKKDEILQKWLTIEYKKEFDNDLIWKILIIFLVIISFIIYKQRLLRKMNDTLQLMVKEKTKELQKINADLEKRVKKEVEENLKKDAVLSKQSKFAAMGEMIQNIAHQWRQPLSIISTGASGLKVKKEIDGKLDDKMLDETLDKIITTTAHLSNTIDDFMHYFKPNKNKEVFKLDDVIEKTLGIFNCNVDDKEIEVIKNVDDISINSFQNEFIQILINIINNSRDAFKEASLDKMYIFIEAKVNKDEVTIEIKDNAGGIKKEIMDKIFDPYFTTKHQYHGTGIGLYMCKEIIDKHIKGTLEAKNVKYTFENRAYKGASFIIKLKA